MKIFAKSSLKRERAKHGFSSQGLADELGLARTHWNLIENGHRATSPETAKRVCEILGVEFDEIFEIEE